jgi:hypothetical protein
VLSSVARVRKQVTGFNLNGFGEDSDTTTVTDGAGNLFGCPQGAAFNQVTGPIVEGETTDEGLEFSSDGGENWQPLSFTPLEEL